MTYKSINTFIDDLFAFVIKMPLMHRLACLRDDLIFFIFLYQRWIYRVDYSRVNEFGQCAIMPEEQVDETQVSSSAASLDSDKKIAEASTSVIHISSTAGGSTGTVARRRRGAKDKLG